MQDKAEGIDSGGDDLRQKALRFVLLIGALSFFADFTYEGARSVTGPYLASLQASGAIVGVVAGLGELLGYGLRLVSGRLADASGQYWPITIFGYVIQMASVPALALTSDWRAAAALILVERVGKAIRNPPRDVMLSYAGALMGGYGWAFGLNEALDQFGAMMGPLAVAAVLAHGGDFRSAFAVLVAPAAVNIALVIVARLLYPTPRDMDHPAQDEGATLCRACSGSIWSARHWSPPVSPTGACSPSISARLPSLRRKPSPFSMPSPWR